MTYCYGPGVFPMTLNEPRYSELLAAILPECQLLVLVQRCSSPADNACTLAPVTSMRPLSEITGQRSADASGTVEA